MENMLGKNEMLRKFFRGPFTALLERLNGPNGEQYLIAFNRFLRGENPWSKTLEPISFEINNEFNQSKTVEDLLPRYNNVLARFFVMEREASVKERELIHNQLSSLTSCSVGAIFYENILVAEKFVETFFTTNRRVHRLCLYELIRYYPSNWKELYNEFNKYSLGIDYKFLFDALDEKTSSLIARDHPDFMENEICRAITIKGISKLKAPLLDQYTEYILRPENINEFDQKFNSWCKFLILVKYQGKEKAERVIKSFLSKINDEQKDKFFKEINYPVLGNYELKEMFTVVDELFSNDSKSELALNFAFGHRGQHIKWIKKEKRLEYLKEKTPINNYLIYLFDDLIKSCNSNKEILSFEDMRELARFYKNKYGRKDLFVSAVLDKWNENHLGAL